MRLEVIATPLLELVEEVRSPILVVNLETVAEDRIRRVRTECLQQSIADILQVALGRARVQMVEHVTFSADGGAFDLHSRAARNKKDDLLRVAVKPHGAVVNVSQFSQAVGNECREELLAWTNVRQRNAARVWLNLYA